MESDFDCYQALRSRDTRFDGLFFVGVKTTGIYCRPVCPARTPMARSCVFVATAAAAERAGFRPCLRCRPELAPAGHHAGSAATTLELALFAAIRAHAPLGDTVEDLAVHTGFSTRPLRRLTLRAFGVTPVEIVQTERLLFAKKLLQETDLPVTTVANGRRSTWRCAPCVFPMRFLLLIPDYARHSPMPLASDPPGPRFLPAPRCGGPGVRMPPGVSGNPSNPIRQHLSLACEGAWNFPFLSS